MRKSGLFLVWILLGINAHAQKVLYSVSELKQDLEVFKAALLEAHPGLYVYHDKAYYDARFAAIKKEIRKPMSEEAFYKLLNPLVAAIRCGHTKWHRDGKPDDLFAFHQEGLFPVKLLFKNKKAYVQYAYGKNKMPVAAEVININGRSIKEITQQLLEEVFADGYVESPRWRMLADNFAGYYVSFIGECKHFKVAYKQPDGVVTVAWLNAVRAADILAIDGEKTAADVQLSFPADSIALLKIPVFMPSDNGPSFEDILQSSFECIDSAGANHLVIDLRDNEGGLDRWGVLLYAWLTATPFDYYDRLTVVSDQPFSFRRYATLPAEYDQLKKFIKKQGNEYVFTMHPNLGVQSPQIKPYTGKLYVLINGLSFSVSSEFSAIVRDYHRGIFIGEESGGSVAGNNSGGFAIVKLPHTHLILGVPLLRYHMRLKGKYPTGRGILPDYTIEGKVKDIIEKKDVILESTLQLIQGKQ